MRNTRIYSHFNRQTFVHVEQVLGENMDMIKFWAGRRENGETAESTLHFVTPEDMRLLVYNMLSGQLGSWISTKGANNDGITVCRILRIAKAKDDDDKYFLDIGHGPGIEQGNLIVPNRKAPKEAWTRESIVFKRDDILKFALTMQAWLNARMVAKALQLT